MSIRPIDMQVILPKVEQNFHSKEQVIHKHQNDLDNLTYKDNELYKQNQTKVRDLEQSSKQKEIRRKEEEQEENSNQKQKNKKNKKQEDREKHIDILI